MSMDLSGEIVLITGASSGLGAHFARTLAGYGASVAMAARRKDRLEALAEDISGLPGRAMAVELDVRNFDRFEAVLDEIESVLGRPSILVNNAGLNVPLYATDVTTQAYDEILDVNLKAPFLLSTCCARRWIRAGQKGRIINIASLAAFRALPLLSTYAVSKAGLVHLTRCLAREWARYEIKVNGIAPGYVETELNAGFWETEAGLKLITRFPRRRIGRPEDLDAIFLALCDPGQRFITGETITVDDGQGLA